MLNFVLCDDNVFILEKLEQMLHKLGVYELMQILHDLHKRGYQKLRWISYMAPTGLSLRCHITTQDHICVNREIIIAGNNNEVWCTSTSVMTTGENIRPFIKIFMDGQMPRFTLVHVKTCVY